MRRNVILGLMAEQGYISAADAARAKAEPVVTDRNRGVAVPAEYFVDAVRQSLEQSGVSLAAGGLRIYTTADVALQRAAVDALVQGTLDVEQRAGYRHPTLAKAPNKSDALEGVVVAIEPSTGDVKALVGGRDHQLAPFNRATNALRQPGSSFKPFVYALALEDSMSAATIVPDSAIAIVIDSARNEIYRPGELRREVHGPDHTARSAHALAQSGGGAARHARRAGFHGGDRAAAPGIDTPIMPVPASALGASAVHPLDYVAAYTVWANLGSVVEPRLVTRIEDAAGRIIYQRPPSHTALGDGSARRLHRARHDARRGGAGHRRTRATRRAGEHHDRRQDRARRTTTWTSGSWG